MAALYQMPLPSMAANAAMPTKIHQFAIAARRFSRIWEGRAGRFPSLKRPAWYESGLQKKFDLSQIWLNYCLSQSHFSGLDFRQVIR
jgi:hypothetical protein